MKTHLYIKKLLSLLLAAILLLALLPISAMAETVDCETCGGSGLVNGEAGTSCPDCEGSGKVEVVPPPECEACGEAHETSACPYKCLECKSTNDTHADTCSHYVPPKPNGCTCEGSTHDTGNAACALNITCEKCGEKHATSACPYKCLECKSTDDTHAGTCRHYVPPKPDGCTCEGSAHNAENTACALNATEEDTEETLPEPIVESTYGEPVSDSVGVSVTWDEDVPTSTSVSFALQYAREGGVSGVASPQTAVKPANAVTFTVPVKAAKTTVTTPVDASGARLTEQAATVESEVAFEHAVVDCSVDEGYKATVNGLTVHVSKKSETDTSEENTVHVTVALNWYNVSARRNPQVRIWLKDVADSTVTVNKNFSSYTFYNLPAKDSDGNSIQYEVVASTLYGYRVRAQEHAVTVTELTAAEMQTSRQVTISWVDIPEDKNPAVTLQLDDGSSFPRTAAVTKSDSEHTFTRLPTQDADGKDAAYTLTASAPYGYSVSVSGLAVQVSYNAEEAANFTDKTVTINWPTDIPTDSLLTIRLKGVAGAEAEVAAGTASHTFSDIPKNDADGAEIVYTVEAEQQFGGYAVTVSELNVTVTPLDETATAALIESINTLIAALPETVPENDVDPETVEGIAGIRETLSQLDALIRQLTDEQLYTITNIRRYYAWNSFANGTGGAVVMSNRTSEGEPSNMTVVIGGSVNFDLNGTTHTVPGLVEVKLLQNGVLVRSQGVKITSNSGTSSFGEWPVYDGATGKAYIYSVVGAQTPNFLSSTAANFAVTYKGVVNPNTETDQSYEVTVNWEHGSNPNVTTTAPKATVMMYKNDAVVTGQTFDFGPTTGTKHTFTVKAKGGDAVRPVPAAVDKYKTAISGLTITYTYVGDKASFSGTITWVNASRFNKPPLTITLEGVNKTNPNDKITRVICSERMDEDNTTYTFNELDANYNYALKSVAVNGTYADDRNYSASFSGHNITVNRYLDPLMRIGVTLRWVDNNNKRERRPIETTVYLYRDGVYTGDEEQIKASDGWETIFFDQPYGDGTHVYKYSIRVAKTPYYWTRYTRLSNFGFLATNFYGGSRSDSESNTGLTPKVGDPTLFRTALSDKMYAEAAESMRMVRNAALLSDNEVVAGSVDFDTLKRLNKDVIAWITLPGTSIDYPVVKGTNNTEYLTRLFSGEANSAGSLFMDYRNSSSFTNRNTTVFGHNMKDGTMFNALLQYKEQSFYKAHSSFSIQTPDGDFTAEPIAAFFTDAAYSNVVKRTFANNTAFMNYVDKCIRASSIQSNATVAATDKLVTFVTCDDDYSANRRFLVVCKLTPAG